ATLIIVMYSAYLQRQANEDARNAMAEQLQQARDATAQQLRQARDATAQQLRQARKALRLQLQQAEESTTKQLELAESSHKAQILESQHAIFSSTFNILLSQKKVVLDNIYTGKEEFKPKFIFETLGCEFEHMIVNDWRELDHRNTKDEEIIFSYFLNTMDGEIQKSFCFNELVSYFYMLVPLILLIKNSKLRDEDKKIFYMVLSHSMTHYEQVTLLWFTLFSPDLKEALTDTQLIDTKFENNEMYFIMKNFSKSCFIHPEVLEHWNNLTKKPS
ncbi:MAG: hypothetical protein IE909_16110, partial [Campylobacterales bacterium]|nr:hypothetical protein [Campylobacterales bacterium]